MSQALTAPGTRAPRAPAAPQASGEPAIVGQGHRFEGLVSFQGSARIEGTVQGEILYRGQLRVEESALVWGDIEGDRLHVAGCVEGDLRARERIELSPTARVVGSLEAPTLVLADGCLVEGRCRTGPPDERPAASPHPGD